MAKAGPAANEPAAPADQQYGGDDVAAVGESAGSAAAESTSQEADAALGNKLVHLSLTVGSADEAVSVQLGAAR